MTAALRVVYLTGWCRSGTTLLGNLLGELPGAIHVGELRYLWLNGVFGAGTNRSCGCGSPLPDCPLWSQVLRRLDATRSTSDMLARQRRHLRTRHTAARLAEFEGRRHRDADVDRTVATMAELYRAVSETGRARTIIDSGKFPAEAAALAAVPGIDLRIVHLVRDPRASAESWRRAKDYIPAMGAVRSTLYWVGFNHASARLGQVLPDRYQRVSYERFVSHPRRELTALLPGLGETAPPPVDEHGCAVLHTNHTVTGNPDRLRTGPVRIRPDQRWRWQAPVGSRLTASLLAAPWLRRYGYRWWPGAVTDDGRKARS